MSRKIAMEEALATARDRSPRSAIRQETEYLWARCATAVQDPVPHCPDGWFLLRDRVPRRDQQVRIWTTKGVDRTAKFVVTTTDDWPSGARWVIDRGDADLPFHEVDQWSADPSASYPVAPAVRPDAVEPTPVETPEPVDAARPAIVDEMLAEIDSVGVLLRRLPKDQLGWSPHPEVPTLGTLSLRLVRIVARIDWIVDLDYIETHFEPDLPQLATVNDIVSTFAANAESVAALAPYLTSERLQTPWRLERNGDIVAQMSRDAALRQFGLSPLVYHKAEAALLMTALGADVPPPTPIWTFSEAPSALAWGASEQGAVGAGDA